MGANLEGQPNWQQELPTGVLGFVMLLTNTSAAAGDLYVFWMVLRLPHKALIYELDPAQTLVFVPWEP